MNDALNATSRRMGDEKRSRAFEAKLKAEIESRFKDLDARITALEGAKSNKQKGAA